MGLLLVFRRTLLSLGDVVVESILKACHELVSIIIIKKTVVRSARTLFSFLFNSYLTNGGWPPGASYSGVESVCDVVAFVAVYDKREFPNTSAPECEAA